MTAPTPNATVTTTPTGARVVTTWTGVQRTDGMGYSVDSVALAERIAAAINDGVWFLTPEVAVDTRGRTYVTAQALTIGKYADETLARLGR